MKERSGNAVLRHLPLEGAANFRDIGGYSTADGRRTAWRRIFRSDCLSNLTDRDIEVVSRLGLRTVYDLRNKAERCKAPDRLPPGVQLRISNRDSYHDEVVELSARIRARIVAGQFNAGETLPWLCARYRLFAKEELDEFRRYLGELLREDVLPMVVHCASGKDRAGFAVALTLMALGVDRETILADYLLSNQYRRSLAEALPPNASTDSLAFLTGVHPSFMLAAFKAIEDEWGDEEAFLTRGLGIGSAERERLRHALLEPHHEA